MTNEPESSVQERVDRMIDKLFGDFDFNQNEATGRGTIDQLTEENE